MKKEFFKKFWWVSFGVSLFFLLLFLDRLSKIWTLHHLSNLGFTHSYPFGGIGIFHTTFGISLSLNQVTNTGAAWGIFAKYPMILFFLRIGLVMILAFTFFQKTLPKMQKIFLVMILAGAMGNLWDVMQYGHVIDMIHFRFGHWSFPIFNLADISITFGISALLMVSLRSKRKVFLKKEESNL